MKKIIMLLLVFTLFLTGCNVIEINTNNTNKLVDIILSKKLNLYNQSSSGYKYYLPRGITIIDNKEYNEKLFSNGNTYYLYVDIVSYHFKKDWSYEENKDAYFSKKLEYNNKHGYLEITKVDNLYFVEMMFNYAKIETLVCKKDIEQAVINASYILNSLIFNDKIIKLSFDDDILNFSEEQFNLFEPKRKEGNFLDYVKEFDQYEGTIDEDLIMPDDTSNNEGTINNLIE